MNTIYLGIMVFVALLGWLAASCLCAYFVLKTIGYIK